MALFASTAALFGAANRTQALDLPLPRISETAILRDPDPGRQDGYGWSLAVRDGIAVIGMPGSTGGPGPSHAAYVYNLHTRQLLQTLVPIGDPPGGSFGVAVALSGNLVVVGSRFEHVQTPTGTRFNAGAAHVYDLNTGQHIARLVANDPLGNVMLGETVAIYGTHVLVGGRAEAAYLFDAISGQQLAKIEPSTPSRGFGSDVALDGSLALIGAAGDGEMGDNSGAAYVYDISTLSELGKISSADAASGDGFGNALALDGNIAAIGSIFHDGPYANSGAVYVYDVTTGEQLAKLLPPVMPAGGVVPNFGVSVGIEDNTVLVGASGISKAFVFDWTTESAIAELVPSDSASTVNFGWDAALDGSHALVSDLQGRVLGAAYVFRIPEPSGLLLALIGPGGFCAFGVRPDRRQTQPPTPIRRRC